VRNVGLVYIDVTGVSRRAILKSVAKGMVVGEVKGGGRVIVGGQGDENISVTGGNGTGDNFDAGSINSARPLKDGAAGPSKGRYT
jgi:spartin